MTNLYPDDSDLQLASEIYNYFTNNNDLRSVNVKLGNMNESHIVQLIIQHRLLGMKEGIELVKDTPPTEVQWGGLARSIMMWLDFSNRTSTSLLTHLKRTLEGAIPQWLLDEPELKVPNKIPSKGTRAVIIYKAMVDALDSSEMVSKTTTTL
jgi:hypothetical protein